MRLAGLFVLLAAFASGGATMVLELSSVRALAPHFGASTETWTSAIAVVLLMLSAGYALGGVLAEWGRVQRSLGLSLAMAGALVSSSPFLLPKLVNLLIPEDLQLGDASHILRTGTWVAQLALFGLPVFLLGFANPLLVKAHPVATEAPGRASGLVLAVSTLGGLLGTFGTTYWFIPGFGTRATLFGCGLFLGLLGTIALAFDRKSARYAALTVLLMSSAAMVSHSHVLGPVKTTVAADCSVVAEREGREQYLRVVDRRISERESERWLQVSECLDSFQSLDRPGALTPGHYYDTLAASVLFSGVESRPHVALLGAGAGSTVRALSVFASDPVVDGVEIDSDILALGREYFRLGYLEKYGAMLGGVDGRFALKHLLPRRGSLGAPDSVPAVPSSRGRNGQLYDAILIDAYARQVEIPFHLVTREMFLSCHRLLETGGVVAVNVSSFGMNDPVLRAIAATLASVFETPDPEGSKVYILSVPGDHNAVVFARKDAKPMAPIQFLQKVRTRDQEPLTLLAQKIALPGIMVPFAWDRDKDQILTDDRAPMEQLQAASLKLAMQARR